MRSLQLFPLPLVVFEAEIVKLHVFEPRYISLIQDCINEDKTFGIVTLIDGTLSNGGAEMQIVAVETHYPSGAMDIVCRALQRFVVLEILPNQGENTAAIGIIEEVAYYDNSEKELNFRISDLLIELYALSEIIPPNNLNEGSEWNEFIHKCGLSLTQELELVSLNNMADRQVFLIGILKSLVSTMSQIQSMKKAIHLNGHFKKLPQSF